MSAGVLLTVLSTVAFAVKGHLVAETSHRLEFGPEEQAGLDLIRALDDAQAARAVLKGIGALAGEPYASGPDCADEAEAEREEAEANRVFDWLKAQL